MNVAYAHGGVIHGATPSGSAVLLDWAFDPTFFIPLLLALLYFRGFVRYRLRGGRRFPLWRPVLFALGLVVVALSLLSPIDLLADASFTWHMVQHDLLMLVAIPLIMLGAPFIPVVRGLPVLLRRRLFIPLARQSQVRRAAIVLTRPVVAFFVYEFTVLLWHLPAFYDAALHSEPAHYAMHGMFIVTGILFWWNLVTPYPFASRLHHLFRILMLFGSSLVNGALSAMIVFSDNVLYAYSARPEFWGLTMLTDQEIGSGLMWVMGGMMRLTAITCIFITYSVQENAKEPGIRLAQERERRARSPGNHSAPQGV